MAEASSVVASVTQQSRRLTSEARYRWGSDESRWLLYTWRAQAR